MFAQSVNPILARHFANAVVSAYLTRPAGALIVTPGVHLMATSPGVITADTPLADLVAVEANFSGYATATPTFSGPGNYNLRTQVAYTNVTFTATTASPFVSNNIYGYWLDDGTNLILAELFTNPTPLPIAKVGDFLDLSLFVPGFCY